jgi:hypothetical protein
MASLSDDRDEPNRGTTNNADRIVSLAFGLIVTMTAGSFFAITWFASTLPSVALA